MPWIIILIVIISLISKANKAKKQKQQAEAQKAAREAMTMEQDPTPRPARPQAPRSARFPDEFEGSPRAKQMTMEGLGKSPERPAPRKTPPKPAAPQRKAPIDTTLTHVVKPVTESRHAHTESSMGGGEACPAPANRDPIPVFRESEPQVVLPTLGFSREEVVKGLLYAEILGKPKALRK